MTKRAHLLFALPLIGWSIGAAAIDAEAKSNPQISPPAYEFAPIFSDGGDAQIVLTAPAGHCSDVRYRIFDTRKKLIARTGWLSPGESDTVEVADRAANATISIGAEGRLGGCNTGSLDSWGIEYGQDSKDSE